MKISTRGRYALEAVLDLAIHSGHEHISLKSIAERREISENYLEQIFVVLRRKGILKSIRGAQGGYLLAYPSDQITAGDILRAVEGPLEPVACSSAGEGKQVCARFEACETRGLWTEMAKVINRTADSVTVKDLMDCHKSQSVQSPDYSI